MTYNVFSGTLNPTQSIDQPRQYWMQLYILNGETDWHGSTLYRAQPSSVHDAVTLPTFIWPAHFSDDFAAWVTNFR